MNRCQQLRSLLPLSAGGELDSGRSRMVREHVERCSPCRSEIAQYTELIVAAKGASGREYGLPDEVRRRIARDAAERSQRPLFRAFPLIQMPARAAWMTSAAAVLVLAVFAATFSSRSGPGRDGAQMISKLDVVADRGVVRLAWSDGEKVSYTVYKSTDPRTAVRGESHVVKGHVWVDTEPDSSPVVFYRIE